MRLALALVLTTALAAGGIVAPAGWRHWQLLEAADDAVALSEFRLGER